MLVSTIIFSVVHATHMRSSRSIFYSEVNEFRSDPHGYANKNDLLINCSDDVKSTYKPLTISEALERASDFQASTLAGNECPIISHDTCEKYRERFGNTSDYLHRIQSFINSTNINEILIKGVKNPYKAMMLFMNSPGHCNRLIDEDTNLMGASFVQKDKNLVVVDFG